MENIQILMIQPLIYNILKIIKNKISLIVSSFLKIFKNSIFTTNIENILVKREHFAVSLRKKKTREIINAKRIKLNEYF